MTRTMTRSQFDAENPPILMKSTFSRPRRPQAVPVRITDTLVPFPITVGYRPSRWQRLRTWHHAIYLTGFVLVLVAAINCAGGRVELFGS